MWSTILAALISLATGLLQSLVNPLIDRYRLIPLLSGIFAAADPVIKKNLPGMSSSDIYSTVRLAAELVADGKLTAPEVDRLTALAFKRFDIRIAANHGVVPQMDTQKLQADVTSAIADYRSKVDESLLATVKPMGAAGLLGTLPKSI